MKHFLVMLTGLLLFTGNSLGQSSNDDYSTVEDLVNTLFIATDAKAWDAVRAVFIDEIEVDFSSLGATPGLIPADNLVAGWTQGLHAQKESHHMTSNHQIVLEGDSGLVTAQGYAYNRLLEPAGSGFWEVWGVYTLPLVRTEAGWRFSGITFEAKHSAGDTSVPGHVLD